MCGTEAPIETHPNFVSFAGTAETPLNGAIFRVDTDSGLQYFDGFGPLAPAEFRGVTSYLISTAISRRTSIQKEAPDASGVGRLSTPPKTFGVDGTWLKTGISAEKRGNVYTVREEWKASGPGGWNTSIYPG